MLWSEGSSDSFILIPCDSFILIPCDSMWFHVIKNIAANFQMALFIVNITNFCISWIFMSGMWTIAKCTLFHKVACVLVGSVMVRLTDFPVKTFYWCWQYVGVWKIVQTCLHDSTVAWHALIALDIVRLHSQRNSLQRE